MRRGGIEIRKSRRHLDDVSRDEGAGREGVDEGTEGKERFCPFVWLIEWFVKSVYCSGAAGAKWAVYAATLRKNPTSRA